MGNKYQNNVITTLVTVKRKTEIFSSELVNNQSRFGAFQVHSLWVIINTPR